MTMIAEPTVQLLRYTEAPQELAGSAAALCYNGKNPDKSLKRALGQRHNSVVQHTSFTFKITGVSRALLAQLTRHRLASFSVESQRYVAMDGGFDYIVPPAIVALGEEEVDRYERQMKIIQFWYSYWKDKGVESEDARMVLPNACSTKVIVTMNARQLIHFLELRLCNRAQWQIRQLAFKMYDIAKEKSPVIFANVGPACYNGKCPEGKMSCGKPWINEERKGD